MTRVLIAGVSTRAAAASAARAGFDVVAIDAFGDADQHASVRMQQLPAGAPFTPDAAARAARTIPCDAVVYLSNFENHPVAITTLAAGRRLWGNPPHVAAAVRDPMLLARTLRRRGFRVPAVYRDASGIAAHPAAGVLVKPMASGGGHDVRPWSRNARVPTDAYLQERIEGVPGSVTFVASAGVAVPLAVTRQLVGDPAFGATDFRYCGSIVAPAPDPQFARGGDLADAACVLASAVAGEFQLVGVNGVDFVAVDGVPYAIEVNPRWCASMELVERARGVSVFAAHAAACDAGELPEPGVAEMRGVAKAVGKAIVYAARDLVMPETESWLSDPTVADVPRSGVAIEAGRPICTVFGEGIDAAACYAALADRAARVYAALGAIEEGAAL